MLSQLIRPLPIEALSQPDWTMWHLIIGRKLTRRQQENMEMIEFMTFQCKRDLKMIWQSPGRLIAEYIGRWATNFQTQGRGLLMVIDQNFDLRQVHSTVSGNSEQAKWTHCADFTNFLSYQGMIEFMLSVYVDVDVERTNWPINTSQKGGSY